jgi:hypothetical protein
MVNAQGPQNFLGEATCVTHTRIHTTYTSTTVKLLSFATAWAIKLETSAGLVQRSSTIKSGTVRLVLALSVYADF